MKFKHLLNEKYMKTTKVDGDVVEIFVNPDPGEIKAISKAGLFKDVRFGVEDKKNGKIYAWTGDKIHEKLLKHIDFDWAFQWTPGQPALGSTWAPQWVSFKNKDSFKKKIKKLIPQVKYIGIIGMDKGRLKSLKVDL